MTNLDYLAVLKYDTKIGKEFSVYDRICINLERSKYFAEIEGIKDQRKTLITKKLKNKCFSILSKILDDQILYQKFIADYGTDYNNETTPSS